MEGDNQAGENVQQEGENAGENTQAGENAQAGENVQQEGQNAGENAQNQEAAAGQAQAGAGHAAAAQGQAAQGQAAAAGKQASTGNAAVDALIAAGATLQPGAAGKVKLMKTRNVMANAAW